jgi:phosphopantetheinyl transferase
MVKVYYSDISNVKDFYIFSNDFCLERKEYLGKITNALRKKQSVMSWWLLQEVIKDFGIKLEELTFELTQSGKWVEKNNKVYFSISHSKEIVAVCVSEDSPISIDVEIIDDRMLSLAKRFNDLGDNIVGDIRVNFAKLWTEKECVIKESSVNKFSNFTFLTKNGKSFYMSIGMYDKSVSKSQINFINIK